MNIHDFTANECWSTYININFMMIRWLLKTFGIDKIYTFTFCNFYNKIHFVHSFGYKYIKIMKYDIIKQ